MCSSQLYVDINKWGSVDLDVLWLGVSAGPLAGWGWASPHLFILG